MEILIAFLEQITGFRLDGRNKNKLASLLTAEMHLTNMATELQYLNYLKFPAGNKDLECLIGSITVNFTQH